MSTRQRGFTLLELLVAMFIAAMMFAIGYGAINQAMKNQDALKEQQSRMKEILTCMRVMEQDFVELEPRPVRQPLGSGYLPAIMGQSDPTLQPEVQFSRGGWNNPTGVQRPGLQRVAYYFEKNTLRREYWTVMDPVQQSKTVKRDLLTNVKSVTFRYMDQSKQWLTMWPPNTVAGATAQLSSLRIRPIAVEVTLDTEDWGKLVRIFEVAG